MGAARRLRGGGGLNEGESEVEAVGVAVDRPGDGALRSGDAWRDGVHERGGTKRSGGGERGSGTETHPRTRTHIHAQL